MAYTVQEVSVEGVARRTYYCDTIGDVPQSKLSINDLVIIKDVKQQYYADTVNTIRQISVTPYDSPNLIEEAQKEMWGDIDLFEGDAFNV